MFTKNDYTLALALCLLSCSLESGGESARPTGAPQQHRAVDASKAKLPNQTVARESTSELRSAEVLARETALGQRFAVAIGRAPSSNLAFIDCQEGPCLARFNAASSEALQALMQGLSQEFEAAGIDFDTRERLDPYMGRSFEVDVTLDP